MAPFGCDFILVAHRGRRGVGHRHRTTYARLGLYHQEFKCRMQHMPRLDAAPGDRCDASLDPKGHECVISGMKLYLVDALPVAVKGLELWRIAIGLHCPFRDFGRTRTTAERGELFTMGAAAGVDKRFLKRQVRCEQVHVFKRRWLIGDQVRFELKAWPKCTHDNLRRVI